MKPAAFAALLAPALALLLLGVAPRADAPVARLTPEDAAAAVAEAAPPPIGPPRLDPELGRYVADLGPGRATLTLDPRLQGRLERTLASYAVPWGVVVLLEPATGRVIAMAEHSREEPERRGLATAALAPAASIFKLVTAAALLERGVSSDDEVCYHGGRRRLQPKHLADDARRDRRCITLESAFGHSANVVFAKLADRGLDGEALREVSERLLFNGPIPFAAPVDVSTADIAEGGFELANTAAGFGPVRLSALHGALLAAVIANGGVLVPPVVVAEAEGAPSPLPPPPWRVLDEEVAAALADMMRSTVTEGTARRVFRETGPLRGISVAGKTGSLADRTPYRDHSWFVGYAPAERPEIAVATLVVNGPVWRVRAPTLAKEALEAYYAARRAEVKARTGSRTARAN